MNVFRMARFERNRARRADSRGDDRLCAARLDPRLPRAGPQSCRRLRQRTM
jgi:hypothetical protein